MQEALFTQNAVNPNTYGVDFASALKTGPTDYGILNQLPSARQTDKGRGKRISTELLIEIPIFLKKLSYLLEFQSWLSTWCLSVNCF